MFGDRFKASAAGKKTPGGYNRALLLALAVLILGLTPACHSKLNDPQELIPFLKVELPGWKLTAGYPQAKRVQVKERSFLVGESLLSSGKSTISLVIRAGEITPEMGMFKAFKECDNEKQVCRNIKVQGFTAVEMVMKDQKIAFLFIRVTDHCLVTMKASEMADTQVLKDLSKKIDLPRLAAMVK